MLYNSIITSIFRYKGAWWYEDCHDSNLMGLPHRGRHSSHGDGINWKTFKGWNYSLAKAIMMVKPAKS